MEKRNHYIDFIKGMTILQVIIIHTAFFSGSSYIPEDIAQLTLFIDVPIFFFMSGWAFRYKENTKENFKNLIRLHCSYLIFMGIVSILLLIFNRNLLSLKNYIYWSIYSFPGDILFNCISASMWFLPLFIIISFICTNILKYIEKGNIKYLIIGLAFFSFYQSINSSTNYNLQYITVFSFFFIFGYLSKEYEIKNIRILGMLYGLLIIIILIYGKTFAIPILKLQWHKMPPKFMYLLCSLFSIVLIIYFKNRIKLSKRNYFVKVGKSSIYYYFAQGISSSILYYIIPYLKVELILIKFLIAVTINVIIAIIIAEILRQVIPRTQKLIKLLFNSTRRLIL